MSKFLKIENIGLTGYYLEDKFVENHFPSDDGIIKGCNESGLVFKCDEQGLKSPEIELHYKDNVDLENKVSYIIMMLTDK